MSSGKSIYSQQVEVYGALTIEAASVLVGKKTNTVTKGLAKDTDARILASVRYIHPRRLWLLHGHSLGVQKLILTSQVLYRCVLAEPRIWTPLERAGPATIIQCDDEHEALIVDYGATPRFIARKLSRWCNTFEISDIAALGVVVPTKEKAEAINKAATDLPLPIRFTISEDLRSLTCGKVQR